MFQCRSYWNLFLTYSKINTLSFTEIGEILLMEENRKESLGMYKTPMSKTVREQTLKKGEQEQMAQTTVRKDNDEWGWFEEHGCHSSSCYEMMFWDLPCHEKDTLFGVRLGCVGQGICFVVNLVEAVHPGAVSVFEQSTSSVFGSSGLLVSWTFWKTRIT